MKEKMAQHLDSLCASGERVRDVFDWGNIKNALESHFDDILIESACIQKGKECASLFDNYQHQYNIVFDPDASDEERQKAFEQLQTVKNEIKQHLEWIRDIAEKEESTQWDEHIEKTERMYADAKFRIQSFDENASELRSLEQCAPAEYLRKSLFFQSKLIDCKKFAQAVDFGLVWIRAVPEKATAQDILHMGNLFVLAGQEVEADWQAYRETLDDVLNERDLRLTENDFATTFDVASSDMGRLEILRGYLYAYAEDFSFRAQECYRNCGALSPENAEWKYWQAEFLVSAMQWDKAMRLLPGLPENQVNHIKESIKRQQTLLFSLCAEVVDDFATLAFKKLPRRLWPLRSVVHMAARPLRKLWLPLVTMDRRWPDRSDCINATVESAFSLSGHRTLRNMWSVANGIRALTQRENRNGFAMIYAIGDASALLLQGWNLFRNASPRIRAVQASLHKVTQDVARVQQLLCYGQLSTLATKWLVATAGDEDISKHCSRVIPTFVQKIVERFANQGLFAALRGGWDRMYKMRYSKSIGYASSLATTNAVAVSSIAVSAAYRFIHSYPRLYAAFTMEEATKLCRQGNYAEAKQLLAVTVTSLWYGEKEAISNYKECIDFFEAIIAFGPDVQSRARLENDVKKINPILDAFASVEEYDEACDEILYQKIVAYLKTQNEDAAREIVKDTKVSNKVLERLEEFSQSQKSRRAKLDAYLDAKDYAAIDAFFRESPSNAALSLYVVDRLIQMAKTSWAIQSASAFFDDFTSAILRLHGFHYVDVFESFLSYLACLDDPLPETRLVATDILLEKLQVIKELSWFSFEIRWAKLSILLKIGEFETAKILCAQEEFESPQWKRYIYTIAEFFFQRGEENIQQNKLNNELRTELERMARLFAIGEQPVIRSYFRFYDQFTKARSEDGDFDNYESALSALNVLKADFILNDFPAPLLLERRKMQLHITVGDLALQSEHIELAQRQYRLAYELSQKLGEVQEWILDIINNITLEV